MKVASEIKENYASTTVKPTTDSEEIIQAICDWNWITLDDFKSIIWDYHIEGKDNNWNNIYCQWNTIINPIGKYLLIAYDWKSVVFEKWDDKFFGVLSVRAETTRYMLWDKVIEIPYRIRAENREMDEGMIIFPKTSDILADWMKSLYVVSPGWAKRQQLEKEIMTKMIELSQVRGWNEIVSTQNMIEELKTSLEKDGMTFNLQDWLLYLGIPRRKIRDTAGVDSDYIAPPITLQIDFVNRAVKCKGYSSHGFWTPSVRWNPCWWNYDTEVYHALQDCTIKWLVNFLIMRAYGYNSDDTWTSHCDRHPLAKLRDYIWYLYENENKPIVKEEIEKMKWHLQEVKEALEIDNYLENNSEIKDFISSLEWDNEASK